MTLTDNELSLLLQLTDTRMQLASSEIERNKLLGASLQANLRSLMVEQEKRDEEKKKATTVVVPETPSS